MKKRLIQKRVLPYKEWYEGPQRNIYFLRRILQWVSNKRYYQLTQSNWPHKYN